MKRCVPDRERPRDNCDDRRSVEDECGPVVHERLALDDRHEPARDAEAARDCARSEWIRRCDDRAEHERRSPGEPEGGVRDRADSRHRRGDETQSEQRDRTEVRAEVAQRREEPSRIEQRGQHADEHELRRQRDARDARHEAERQPAEDEQDRVRDAQRWGERHQSGYRCEQSEQDELGVSAEVHRSDDSSRASSVE